MSWGDVAAIFNPGHQHWLDEQERRLVDAQIVPSTGDPLIDLEAGRVTLIDRRDDVALPAKDPDLGEAPGTEDDDPAG